MRVSFVIVTHQRDAMLRRCLASIYAQEGLPRPFEVVVVDNGGDGEVLPPDDSGIKLVVDRPAQNLNATGGRNRAIKLASGDIVVGLDDDAEWSHPGAVRAVLDVFDEFPDCGLVAGRTMDVDGQAIQREIPYPDKMFLSQRTTAEVPYFVSACWAGRAAVLKETGLYDEQMGIYGEEYDLSMRVIAAGYKIVYHADVSAIHHHAPQGRMAQSDYWIANARNKFRANWRYMPQPYPLTTLVIWTGAVLVNTRSLAAVFRLWRDLWSMRRELATERHPLDKAAVRYLRHIGARLSY